MSGPRSILIAGGGTAGWMTAGYLARVFGKGPDCPQITLIESPDIGTVGVGEGSFATIRTTLKTLGIDEETFLRESTATFKQGIRFVDWQKTPQNGEHEHYIHPFDPPYFVDGAGLLPYWLLKDEATRGKFADAVAPQVRVAEGGRAPKRIFEGHYDGRLNYAYHFDAGKFGQLLGRHARSLGVRHLQGRISDVQVGDDGAIAGITSPEHGQLSADFYIDCTGFAALLIGKALKSPFKSVKDVLLTDTALAIQVPYPAADTPIESYTISTGHEAGWTWDIGLDSRRGVGYVYSSAHTSDDRAEAVLRGYLGSAGRDLEPRRIRFDTGYREAQWIKNCASVGLSAGFFEPLEATGIMMIEVAIGMIMEYFPHSGPIDASARKFNELMRLRNEKTVNFLKLHYCVSQREEPFWRDNVDPASIPEELRELLAMWKHRPPSRYDIISDIDTFADFSYQYILYGMGFKTDLSPMRASYPHVEAAERVFTRLRAFSEGALRDLPPHRELIDDIYRNGFRQKPADKLMTVKA